MQITLNKKSIIIFIIIFSLVAFLCFLFLAIISFYSTATFIIFMLASLGVSAMLIANIIAGSFSNTVEINETGVYFKLKKKSLHMGWESIRMIAVSKYGLGKFSKRIIFSSKYNKDILRLIYPYSALSNDLLFLQNRKGLIKEIEKYWNKDIINKNKNAY